MKYLVLTLRRADFDHAVLPKHYAFLEQLRSEGRLEQSGAFTDGSGGAYCADCRVADADPADAGEAARLWALSAELTGIDAAAPGGSGSGGRDRVRSVRG